MHKRKNSRGRLADGSPNPVDVHVGMRIRLRRKVLGLTQEQLAKLLSLTFQQIQKYEKGLNRISASRLWDIAQVLQTSTDFFFQDMDTTTAALSPREKTPENEVFIGNLVNPMDTTKAVTLVKNFSKINNRVAAEHIFATIAALANSNFQPSTTDK